MSLISQFKKSGIEFLPEGTLVLSPGGMEMQKSLDSGSSYTLQWSEQRGCCALIEHLQCGMRRVRFLLPYSHLYCIVSINLQT